MDCGFEAFKLPSIVRFPTIFVGTIEQQIPRGVEGVHLELNILMIVAIGIDKHFEIIVLEDDSIMLRQRPLKMRFRQLRSDV